MVLPCVLCKACGDIELSGHRAVCIMPQTLRLPTNLQGSLPWWMALEFNCMGNLRKPGIWTSLFFALRKSGAIQCLMCVWKFAKTQRSIQAAGTNRTCQIPEVKLSALALRLPHVPRLKVQSFARRQSVTSKKLSPNKGKHLLAAKIPSLAGMKRTNFTGRVSMTSKTLVSGKTPWLQVKIIGELLDGQSEGHR